jgi:L-lactate dehydrogenase complex protein LldF
MTVVGSVFDRPSVLRAGERLAALARHVLAGPRGIDGVPGPFGGWFDSRDMPAPAPESFRTWWTRTDGGRTDAGNGRMA